MPEFKIVLFNFFSIRRGISMFFFTERKIDSFHATDIKILYKFSYYGLEFTKFSPQFECRSFLSTPFSLG